MHEQENFICVTEIAVYHVVTKCSSFKSAIGLNSKFFMDIYTFIFSIIYALIHLCRLLLHTFLSTKNFLITIINLTCHLLLFRFSIYVITAMINITVQKGSA